VQHVRIGQGTLPLIDIGHDDAKCALSQSRHNRLRLPKPRDLRDKFRLHCRQGTRTICSTSSVMCPIKTAVIRISNLQNLKGLNNLINRQKY
jgi:hypothetical protein